MAESSWQNRITRTGEEDPRDLQANPANWRTHGQEQRDIAVAMIGSTGWVRDVIVNETTGHLLDGHMRVALAVERRMPTVPVSYVALTEEEEALALATFDPLAELALTDTGKLSQAMRNGNVEDWASALLGAMRERAGAPDELPTGAVAFREEAMDSYLNGDQRQIHVPMLVEEYVVADMAMGAIKTALDFGRNTDVLLWLIEQDQEAQATTV